jgi:dTDP-glucose pyrophosphorylase
MRDWKRAILKNSKTMRDAIELLDYEETKIVMVSDNFGKLVGTITDGDIRRALIKRQDMDTKLSEIMFKEPTVAHENDSESFIMSIMKNLSLRQIPIVDDHRHIIGLKIGKDFLRSQTKDNPVFLMAGGFGTRLQPLTKDIPKPLLNVGGKPILEIILNQFIELGFHIFYISTHYKAEMLSKYFGDGSNWGVSINYIYEERPLGTAGALGLLQHDLLNLPVIVMNGDLLTKVNIDHLLSFHNEQGGVATMAVREYDFQVPYGVVEVEDQQIKSIVEKPTQSFFVNAGVYVLSKSIIKKIDKGEYLDMTNLLAQEISNLEQINMFPIHEYWLDIGQHEQFEQAQLDYKEFL